MTFRELNLIEPLLKAVEKQGYSEPSPIQSQAIPVLLEKRDLIGCAQTGTGKTAAFALPILQNLSESKKRGIRALVLTPTRELALQIYESFRSYGANLRLKSTVVFGGVGQNPQVEALRRGVDILVATPGRLNDLMNQGYIKLGELEVFVLDEADRMLDMGFINDVKRVLRI
ncbi:MAG: DEAD/DEAH box helicase, partial [Oscillospiraceae bacterium]